MPASQLDVVTAAQLSRAVYNHKRDWLLHREADTVWIGIEGTDNLLDWRRNLESAISSDDQHIGFKNYACRLMAELLSHGVHINRHEHLVLCGHSLGGAVATIIAAALQQHLPHIDLITFGSPRPGGRKFRERLRVPHRRYVHGNDIVPHLPSALLGFRHTAPALLLPEPNDSILHGVSDHAMDLYIRRLTAC